MAERDADGKGFTPLDRAAVCTQPEGAAAGGVRLLVAAGADATAEDHSGYTALHFAALFGPDDPALAGVLMGAGCDPAAESNVYNGQNTALGYAKETNKPRMAALLEAARRILMVWIGRSRLPKLGRTDGRSVGLRGCTTDARLASYSVGQSVT